ncbi:MAG: acyltransferase [Thermomicrobiales bacterium]|nr:acyltransferase [Thermomicrobiales bacterium]
MTGDLGSFEETLTRRRLPALDGLRAVAVFLVMLFHFGHPIPGDLGVTLFFVLSGFLITRLLLIELHGTGTIAIRAFYLRRTLRIVPAFSVYLLLIMLIAPMGERQWTFESVLSAATYTKNYVNAFTGHPVDFVSHTWSLAVEEQFYLCWPLGLALLARRRVSMPLVAGIAILAVLIWRSGLVFGLSAGHAYVYNAFDTRADSLLIGCLVAMVCDQARFRRRVERAARWAWLPIVPMALIAYSRLATPQTYRDAMGFTVDSLLIAVVLLLVMRFHAHPLWSWLDRAPVRFLGVISYSMYLYQQPIAYVGRTSDLAPQPVETLLLCLLTILLATCSYLFVERPCLRLKSRLATRARTSTGEATEPLALGIPTIQPSLPH